MRLVYEGREDWMTEEELKGSLRAIAEFVAAMERLVDPPYAEINKYIESRLHIPNENKENR
jgi:hypothetical protein